jgi:hypothetical protein
MTKPKPARSEEAAAVLQDIVMEMIATNILLACNYGEMKFPSGGPQTDGLEKVKYFVEEMVWPAVEVYFHQNQQKAHNDLFDRLLSLPRSADAELGVSFGHRDANGVFHRDGPTRVFGNDGKLRREE